MCVSMSSCVLTPTQCIEHCCISLFETPAPCPAVRCHSVMSDSLQPQGLEPVRLLCPWVSPGKSPGVGCHALLQEIFPTQGSNSGLLLPLQFPATLGSFGPLLHQVQRLTTWHHQELVRNVDPQATLQTQ